MSSTRITLLLLVAITGVVTIAAGTAGATSPGKNGQIVFRRYLNIDHSAGALFVVNSDGSGLRQLTHPAAGRVLDNEPDWSPNGRQVVFQRADENACGDDSCETDQIMVVNADGSGLHAVASDPTGKNCATDNKPAGGLCRSSPAWSADGTRVVFSCGTPWIPGYPESEGLCIVNADGSGTQTFLKAPKGMNDDGPQFSPDGKRIALERAFDAPDGGTLRVAVFVMNADGSGARRVTPWGLRAGDHPDWSPVGQRILVTTNVEGPSSVSSNKYSVKPDGTGLHALTHATGGSVQWMSSSYSPDGKWIVVARRTAVENASVWVMHADGTHARPVTHAHYSWDSAPDWSSAT
jgi:TolB protein